MAKLNNDEFVRLVVQDESTGKASYAEVLVGDIVGMRPHIAPVPPVEMYLNMKLRNTPYDASEVLDAAIKVEAIQKQFAQMQERERWVKTDVILKSGMIIWTALTITGVHLRLINGNPGD